MTALKAATGCRDGRNVRIHAGIVVSIDIVIGPLALPAPRPVRATQVLRPPRLMAQSLSAARVAPLSTGRRVSIRRRLAFTPALRPVSDARMTGPALPDMRCLHDGTRCLSVRNKQPRAAETKTHPAFHPTPPITRSPSAPHPCPP